MNRIQRHLGRELALQWLFQIDVACLAPAEVTAHVPDELEEWIEAHEGVHLNEEGIDFARQLVKGVIEDRERIDEAIVKYAKGWAIERMAGVERNILRIALYEILDVPDIPTSVSVDEAVEVAKRFGTEESTKFVNGILGAFLRGERDKPEMA